MPDRLRIAHCADIHLDADHGVSIDALRDAFMTALASMCAHRPDLMLLAGDLFDSNRASAATVEWAMDTLARQPFPIVMIPGNHDCMEPGGVYARHDFNAIPKVHILAAPEGSVIRLPELSVAAWGKGMVEHAPRYRPLGGCPERPADCRWYLGLAHGLFVPHGGETDRASPIHMREIEASPCDYLALGHHHAAMELVTSHAVAAYSGSPTDRIGRGPTYAIADLSDRAGATVAIHTIRETR